MTLTFFVADFLSLKSFLNTISIPDNPIIAMAREASTRDLEYQKLLELVMARKTSGIPHPSIINFSCSVGCLIIEKGYVSLRI